MITMDRFVKATKQDNCDTKTHKLNDTSWIITGKIPITLRYSFDELWSLHPENHDTVMMYGKEIPIPRYQSNYLRDYTFSGKSFPGKPLDPQFQPFLDWANSLGYGTFNGVLVNFYENKHYIGPHRDGEQDLVDGSPIISLSLGGSRMFRVRKYSDKTKILDLEMHDRDYIVMCGRMQREYTHEIVKISGKKLLGIGNRINITFRIFK